MSTDAGRAGRLGPPGQPSTPAGGAVPHEIAVQVLLEIDSRGKWTAHSLELLGDGQSLAQRLGGVVGGWFLAERESAGNPAKGDPCSPSAANAPDWNELAAHGCRRLRVLRHERFASWSSEAVGAALAGALSPTTRAILLPGTPRGEETAGLLAARSGLAWIADVITLGATRAGVLEIAAIEEGGRLSRTFRAESGLPVIATVRPGVAEARRSNAGTVETEETSPDLAAVPELTRTEEFIPADPKTIDLAAADRIVSAGRGAGDPEGVLLVSRLADALHASLGGSRMAVDLGWLPPARQVGQTGRTVNPELYVACGISGASHHLVGMRQSRHIVAVNSDPKAPIHGIAHLSLKTDLRPFIPEVLQALRRREGATPSTPGKPR